MTYDIHEHADGGGLVSSCCRAAMTQEHDWQNGSTSNWCTACRFACTPVEERGMND